jgi:hypothetical protein
MTPQEKAKSAISQLPRLYGEFDSSMQRDKGLHNIIIGLELLRQIANGTHVIVPVDITKEMAWQLENHFAKPLPPSDVHRANWAQTYRAMINEVE